MKKNICLSNGCDNEITPASSSLLCSKCEINKSQTNKIAIVISIIGLMVILFVIHIANSEEPFFSSLGGFIGGVASPLVALAGVILLYDTLTLQRKELKEAREQFRKSSAALEKQTDFNKYSLECKELYLNFKPYFNETLSFMKDFPKIRIHKNDVRFDNSSKELSFNEFVKIGFIEEVPPGVITYYRNKYKVFYVELAKRLIMLSKYNSYYKDITKPEHLDLTYEEHPEIKAKCVELFFYAYSAAQLGFIDSETLRSFQISDLTEEALQS